MANDQQPTLGELRAELDRLNQAVDEAIARRKEWMDAHMEDFSPVKVGQGIWNLNEGICLGRVTALYRYLPNNNPRFDRSMSVDAQYETNPGLYDNTSRQIGLRWGSKEQALEEMARRAESLVRIAKSLRGES